MIGEIGTHPKDGKPMLLVEAQEEWRAWLEVKHEESSGVWLVSWKKATERPYVPFSDVVDEALCFGWVDSKINRLDEERAMRLFTPGTRRVRGRGSTRRRSRVWWRMDGWRRRG